MEKLRPTKNSGELLSDSGRKKEIEYNKEQLKKYKPAGTAEKILNAALGNQSNFGDSENLKEQRRNKATSRLSEIENTDRHGSENKAEAKRMKRGS